MFSFLLDLFASFCGCVTRKEEDYTMIEMSGPQAPSAYFVEIPEFMY